MNAHGPDVSFYKDNNDTPVGIDFEKMKLSSDFVIIRAGQKDWPDEDFWTNWKNAKLAKLPRGSYWFYDSRLDPITQANKYIEMFNGDFGELPLFADYEENYGGQFGGWKFFKLFLQQLKALLADLDAANEVGIYTAYYYWKDHCPNPLTDIDEYNWFRQFPLWIANYGASSPAVPDPWGANEWLFWQYTETGDGKLYGVESSTIDLNWFNGTKVDFAQRFNLDMPTNPDPIPEFKEFLYKIKPENIIRAYVTNYPSNRTVESVAKEFHATCQPGNHSLVINGDGWRINGVANGDWVSNGIWKHIQAKDSYSPRITFDIDSVGAIAGARGEYWYPSLHLGDYNAFGLTRRLIKNGTINPAYQDTGELNARTTFGFTPDGTLVIYICDGWDRNVVTGEPPRGRTIKETGEILIANDVIEGGDGDGGGSVTVAEDGIVVNKYSDDGVPIMRATVNHLCLEINIPIKGDSNMATETYKTNKKAQLYNANGVPRETIDAETVVTCDVWAWDSGALKGMQKLINWPSVRFIKSDDIDLYVDPGTDPTPDPTPAAYSTPAGAIPLEKRDDAGNLVQILHNKETITWI